MRNLTIETSGYYVQITCNNDITLLKVWNLEDADQEQFRKDVQLAYSIYRTEEERLDFLKYNGYDIDIDAI